MFNYFFTNIIGLKKNTKFFYKFILYSDYLNFPISTYNFTNKYYNSSLKYFPSYFNLKFNEFKGVNLFIRRYYRPDLNIDWVGIKRRCRIKQVLQDKKKHKNHPRVSMRFRLTRFGWERLQSGRNSKKLHLSRLKYKNKMRIKYVSRCDLKKLQKQMPGYRLRIRDPPINNNPNIRNIRKIINCYFG